MNLRIHFAAIHAGRGAAQWRNFSTMVIDPAVELRADRLHVLYPEGKEAQVEQTINFLRDQAQTKNLDIQFHGVGFTTPAEAAAVVGRLISERSESANNSVHYNIASGPRESPVVAFLVAQYWPLAIYSAVLDQTSEPTAGSNEWRFLDVDDMPAPIQNKLEPSLYDAVRHVSAVQSIKQRQLITELVEDGHINAEGVNIHQANQSQFQKIGKLLDDRGYARKVGTGRNCRWELTPNGNFAAKVLGFDVGLNI